MSMPHPDVPHRLVSPPHPRPIWLSIALIGVTAASLLMAGTALWYALTIAAPNRERADQARRMEQSYLDVLTKHLIRVEETLHLR